MNEENQQLEEGRLAALQASRKQSRAQAEDVDFAGSSTAAIGISGILMFGLAVGAQFLDWIGLGAIPIIGDAIDFLMGLTIWLWVKIKGLDTGKPWWVSGGPWMATGVQVIPFIGDMLPAYIASVASIMIVNSAYGRRIMKTMKTVAPV